MLHSTLINFILPPFQVEDLSREPQVERELMLIKLNAELSTKAEVFKDLSSFLVELIFLLKVKGYICERKKLKCTLNFIYFNQPFW